MHLGTHVEFHEFDAVAQAESEESLLLETVSADLRAGADEEVPEGLKLQAAMQDDAFDVGVFLHLELPDEILGETVAATKSEGYGQGFVVNRLGDFEVGGIEDVGSKCQFVSDFRLQAEFKGQGTFVAIVFGVVEEDVVELQADLQVSAEVAGVCDADFVFVVAAASELVEPYAVCSTIQRFW